MKKCPLRLLAGFVLICFTLNSMGLPRESFASTAAMMPGSGEVKVSAPFELDIPAEFGKIETLVSGSGAGPAVIHIQEAHGNYEGQKKIFQILKHLKKTYGIHTIFLEGTAFKLHKDMLQLYPGDPKRTLKDLDLLAKQSIVTGPEFLLAQDPEMEAYGIEDLETYIANSQAFVSVLRQKEKTEKFIQAMDAQMKSLSSPYLNSELRAFLDRSEDYELHRVPVETWLEFLKTQAGKHLGADFSNPWYQRDWPMMLRIFTLQKMEKEFDKAAFEKERPLFLEALQRFLPKDGKDFTREISKLIRAPLSQNQLPHPETSEFFETMVSKLPPDFNYQLFPNVNRFIGHLILQSELDGAELAGEIQRLETSIAEILAKTEQEKKLLSLLKRERLLKRLFALELTPGDYETVLSEKKEMEPRRLAESFLAVNPTKRVRNPGFHHTEEMTDLFTEALEFYRLAKVRDKKMIGRFEERLKETGAVKAVVITGGFHSGPFAEHFKKQGNSYALITPKITSADGHASYVKLFLENSLDPAPPQSALKALPYLATTRAEMRRLGVNPAGIENSINQTLGSADWRAGRRIESKKTSADPGAVSLIARSEVRNALPGLVLPEVGIETETLKRIETIIAELDGKEITETAYNRFLKEYGFVQIRRGTYRSSRHSVYFYNKGGFFLSETKALAQSKKNMAEQMTQAGILHPDVRWGVFRVNSGYALYAAAPGLKAVDRSWIAAGKNPPEAMWQPFLRERDIHTVETDSLQWGYELAVNPRSHVYQWLKTFLPNFNPDPNIPQKVTFPKIQALLGQEKWSPYLYLPEALTALNWGWDKSTGKLYPLDIEVISFEKSKIPRTLRSETREIEVMPFQSLPPARAEVRASQISQSVSALIPAEITGKDRKNRIEHYAKILIYSAPAIDEGIRQRGVSDIEYLHGIENISGLIETAVKEKGAAPDNPIRILDVGAGKGFFLRGLADELASVTHEGRPLLDFVRLDGLDPIALTQDQKEALPKKISFHQGLAEHMFLPGENWVLPDNSYDFIFSTEALQYSYDPFAAMAKIYSKLKLGGHAYLTGYPEEAFVFEGRTYHFPSLLPDDSQLTQEGKNRRVRLKKKDGGADLSVPQYRVIRIEQWHGEEIFHIEPVSSQNEGENHRSENRKDFDFLRLLKSAEENPGISKSDLIWQIANRLTPESKAIDDVNRPYGVDKLSAAVQAPLNFSGLKNFFYKMLRALAEKILELSRLPRPLASILKWVRDSLPPPERLPLSGEENTFRRFLETAALYVLDREISNPNLEELLEYLDHLVGKYNEAYPDSPQLSLPMVMILPLSHFFGQNTAKSQFVVLRSRLHLLPGEYGVDAVALDLLLTGMHLRGEINLFDQVDLKRVLPNLKFAFEILDPKAGAEPIGEFKRNYLKFSLLKLLLTLHPLLLKKKSWGTQVRSDAFDYFKIFIGTKERERRAFRNSPEMKEIRALVQNHKGLVQKMMAEFLKKSPAFQQQLIALQFYLFPEYFAHLHKQSIIPNFEKTFRAFTREDSSAAPQLISSVTLADRSWV